MNRIVSLAGHSRSCGCYALLNRNQGEPVDMKKPTLVVIDNLLMPIVATETRVAEIQHEMSLHPSPVVLNGLFLMLVSYVESMQKSVLTHHLKYQPEEMPVKRTMEIDKAALAANEDFYLLEHLISEFLRGMSYPQFSEVFYKTLGIKKPKNESKIREIKTKRNEVIHRNLRTDFKHKRATHEQISPSYLSSSVGEYTIYLNSLKNSISEKYVKCTKLNALRELWHYTFATPLCAVFEDFWHVDTDKDSITGYKSARGEANLSHSETFMLSIWRSQVSGYKVDFLNMASLDRHMQYCLYTFLKLSNDIFMY